MILKEAIYHKVKSNYCYAYDDTHLSITLRVKKDDIDKCYLLLSDPHNYKEVEDGTYVWAVRNDPHQLMEKKYSDELFDYYHINASVCYKRAKYIFLIYKGIDTYIVTSKGIYSVNYQKDQDFIYNNQHFYCYPYINHEDIPRVIPWATSTIWYQIFPERFAKGSNTVGNYLPWGSVKKINNDMFFGGNLRGVIEKVPYFKELGITGIYFNPIFKASTAHKYDTIDYMKIDESFGTNEDLKELVKVCHENDIKVMLDGVFNHCGFLHPFFQDVVKKGKDSKYYDCFFINKEPIVNFPLKENGMPNNPHNFIPNFTTFAFTPSMPKLNISHPIIENHILDVCEYWIKECDIDAWRLDVSNEVSHQFWRKFRQKCDSLKKDFYILGENWEDSNPWLQGEELDAVMNYELTYPIWNFFTPRDLTRINAEEFTYKINDILIQYSSITAQNMFNLIDSHDTKRILYLAHENKELMKLPYIFLFSFCGSPNIYYGDEVGMTGGADPDNRRCMVWDEKLQDKELFAFFKKLIAIRKENKDFNLVDIKWLYKQDNVIAYTKGSTVIILNNNDHEVTISIKELINVKLTDLWTKKDVTITNTICLKNYGYMILKGEDNGN